jgi:uncharacterized protein
MAESSGAHPLVEDLSGEMRDRLTALRGWFAGHRRVCVAYSGGVDSTLVAAIAAEQLAEGALAVTGVSAALAPHLREQAREQARWIGIRHREIPTREIEDPAYASNPGDRCYACKRELHRGLAPLAATAGDALVVDGVNLDDLADHRPGIQAARERGVRSPLAEVAIDKRTVRTLSRALGFPWWDKPAQPCLASRFPYGEPITVDRLTRVARAEAWLTGQGFRELRVRCQGDAARIELPAETLAEALNRWSEAPERDRLVRLFRSLGFSAVSLDLEGLVSGKLNRALPEQIRLP